jgi:hypothetical protein
MDGARGGRCCAALGHGLDIVFLHRRGSHVACAAVGGLNILCASSCLVVVLAVLGQQPDPLFQLIAWSPLQSSLVVVVAELDKWYSGVFFSGGVAILTLDGDGSGWGVWSWTGGTDCRGSPS